MSPRASRGARVLGALERRILGAIRESGGPVLAREIVTILNRDGDMPVTRSEINSSLYSPRMRPEVVRSDDYRWSLSGEEPRLVQKKTLKRNTAPGKSAEPDTTTTERPADVGCGVFKWDEAQRRVIEAPSCARLLVNAAPGTGKTAVACARVAWLINNGGTEATKVWLISFTRTAVREVCDRMSSHLRDPGTAYAVKVATLDSHAWAIHSGFDGTAKIGSYEENIQRLVELVRTDGGVADYLHELEHLVVDEAQDIVGVRADLIVELIRRLSPSCGVTVFADEAQAIYGFAEDEDAALASGQRQPPLIERLRAIFPGVFEERQLETVHRTGSSRLKRIFVDTRRRVIDTTADSQRRLGAIRSEIIEYADGELSGDVRTHGLEELDDAFVLYRRRADVLLASSFLGEHPHRTRISSLPACIEPWVGACLGTRVGPNLRRDAFREMWSEHIDGVTALATRDVDSAWALLVQIAGQSEREVDLSRLRQRLGRGRPPADLCRPDFGTRGPVLGTIHACKGREASTVHLMLPGLPGGEVDHDEETRVVFVGATRARVRLLVGNGYRQYVRSVASGRAYSPKTGKGGARAQVEIGRDGDIDPAGLAGRHLYPDADHVRAVQRSLADLPVGIVSATAVAEPALHFTYRVIQNQTSARLGFLSQRVNSDLFEVGDELRASVGGGKRRPPDQLPYLRIFGLRTVAVAPEAPVLEQLHEPWSRTGFLLAPLIVGYTMAYFPFAR